MSGLFALKMVLIGILASSAVTSFAQSAQSESEDDLGPPHEDIFRAQERISAVLCKAPSKSAEERRLDRKYGKRIAAINGAVSREFGEKAANADWISVLPCNRFRSESKFRTALREAEVVLCDTLKKWEFRYGLNAKLQGN